MARFHYNIYPIFCGCFSYTLDELKNFYHEIHPGSPLLLGDAQNDYQLKSLLNFLPKNCTYMVLNSNGFSVWILPSDSYAGIEHLLNNGHIDLNRVSRDVRYHDLRKTLDNLPCNYHYIVQRYYE